MRHHKYNNKFRAVGRKAYYMPETLPFILCSACIQVAMQESPEAKTIYCEIVESYRLPDLQKGFQRLELRIPDSKELAEKIGKRLGLEEAQKKANPGVWLPDGKTLELIEEMTWEYFDVFSPWIDWKKGTARSRDFAYFLERVREF